MRTHVDCRSPDGRPDMVAPHWARAQIGRFESVGREEQEAEKTIDWVSTTAVGRQSGPSRREGNTSDRGGSNG
jgi:hypothetical protein